MSVCGEGVGGGYVVCRGAASVTTPARALLTGPVSTLATESAPQQQSAATVTRVALPSSNSLLHHRRAPALTGQYRHRICPSWHYNRGRGSGTRMRRRRREGRGGGGAVRALQCCMVREE